MITNLKNQTSLRHSRLRAGIQRMLTGFPVKPGMTMLVLVGFASILTPSVTFASITDAFGGSVSGFVCLLMSSISLIIPILSGVALLCFFWGIAQFILNADNEKEIANGRRFMIWSVIALFVLVSFWGIITFLSVQFNFSPSPAWPFLPSGGNSTSCGSTGVASSNFFVPTN